MNGGAIKTNEVPDAEESRRFWGDIWTVEKEHNKDVDWLSELKDEVKGRHSQKVVTISIENFRKKAKKMPNWKSPIKDGVQGYCIKILTNIHDRFENRTNFVWACTSYQWRLDIKVRKLLTMNKVHQPKASGDRLYIRRSEGGKDFCN